jgi:hypothetical protein
MKVIFLIFFESSSSSISLTKSEYRTVLLLPTEELKRRTSNKKRITSQPRFPLILEKDRFLGGFPEPCG